MLRQLLSKSRATNAIKGASTIEYSLLLAVFGLIASGPLQDYANAVKLQLARTSVEIEYANLVDGGGTGSVVRGGIICRARWDGASARWCCFDPLDASKTAACDGSEDAGNGRATVNENHDSAWSDLAHQSAE